ncbi:MAG TPA: outer membrane protein assembly factor BamD [Vicinamibacterales bacterium]|nr:outer membrane protein assembly factor BamD [Vicinamibacterales bacterium]
MDHHHSSARLRRWRLLTIAAGAAALVSTAVASGCASRSTSPPTGTPEPDRFLFERGTEALNQRRWFTAREFFRQLVDTYPQSPYRADGKLGIADTFLGEGSAESYVLAQNEFREFLSFYPTHRNADYAQYKLGMVHFYQMHGPDRDQTETREAIRELAAFLQRYPDSEFAAEGRKHLRVARDRLSEASFRVGVHYYRSRWYPGAVDRFREVLDNDPEYTNRDAVYHYMGETMMKIQRPAEALPYFERLIAEFEQSEYLENAQKRVGEIKAELAARIK